MGTVKYIAKQLVLTRRRWAKANSQPQEKNAMQDTHGAGETKASHRPGGSNMWDFTTSDTKEFDQHKLGSGAGN